MPTVNWNELCAFAERPWTPEFVARHRVRLSARTLFENPAFPWSKHAKTLEPNRRKLAELVFDNSYALPPKRLLEHREAIDWSLFERNDALTLGDVEAGSGCWRSRSIVELGQLGKAAKLPLATLVTELPARLAAALELETVEAFLLALARLGERRNLELESAIAASPDELAHYDVYADWLEAQGNGAHAELLRALREPARRKSPDRARAQPAAWQAGPLVDARLH